MRGRVVRKRSDARSGPEIAQPTFCSASTLSKQLDCTEEELAQLVASGVLPPAKTIGQLARWQCSEVRDRLQLAASSTDTQDAVADPYLARIDSGAF